MGIIVDAVCPCGFEEPSIFVGGGVGYMGINPNIDYYPCICNACHSVARINLKANEKRCPKCRSRKVTPYNDPRLSETKRQVTEEERYNSKTFEGNYLCPKCNKMTLRFEDAGCWD